MGRTTDRSRRDPSTVGSHSQRERDQVPENQTAREGTQALSNIVKCEVEKGTPPETFDE